MASDVVEIDALTGEVVERSFTPEERQQHAADMAAAAAAEQARAQAEAAASAARAAAVAHARDLGFTDEMIAQMWPGLA